MKPLAELNKLLREDPLAGIYTRAKLYCLSATITSSNTISPAQKVVSIPPSEDFWLRGIYVSYYTTNAGGAVATPFINIKDSFNQQNIMRGIGAAAQVLTNGAYGYPVNLCSPGLIPEVKSHPYGLQTPVEIDLILQAQTEIIAEFWHPGGAVGTLVVDIAFMGLARRRNI